MRVWWRSHPRGSHDRCVADAKVAGHPGSIVHSYKAKRWCQKHKQNGKAQATPAQSLLEQAAPAQSLPATPAPDTAKVEIGPTRVRIVSAYSTRTAPAAPADSIEMLITAAADAIAMVQQYHNNPDEALLAPAELQRAYVALDAARQRMVAAIAAG